MLPLVVEAHGRDGICTRAMGSPRCADAVEAARLACQPLRGVVKLGGGKDYAEDEVGAPSVHGLRTVVQITSVCRTTVQGSWTDGPPISCSSSLRPRLSLTTARGSLDTSW
jgi:hypothetical protein